MSNKTRRILLFGIPIGTIIILSFILQGVIFTREEEFINWLKQLGAYIILAYIPLQVITIVFSPVSGFFLHIALLATLPPFQAFVLMYAVATPVYMINFFIARRFGRPLVRRIVGGKAMDKIDHMAQDLGVSTLVILKLFQNSIFDYLAYAVGLTSIRSQTFAIVNFLGGLPGTLIQYFIFTRFENFTLGIVALVLFGFALFLLSLLLNYLLKKHKGHI